MEDKIKIHREETIRKILSNSNKLNDLRKEKLASFDKTSLMKEASGPFVKVSSTGLAEIVFALQQHANGGGLADIVNSILQHTNNNLHKILCLIAQKRQETNIIGNIGTKENCYRVHSASKDNSQTVARLLGEVVSDFLVGLSKNESNLMVKNLASYIIDQLDNLEFNRLEPSQYLLKVLDFLSSPIYFTNEKRKASNDKIINEIIDNNETNRMPNM